MASETINANIESMEALRRKGNQIEIKEIKQEEERREKEE